MLRAGFSREARVRLKMLQKDIFTATPSLWVFGYGSLIWNPGFKYAEKRKAYALGYARRMYQGNTFHRGDEHLPGRVATLIHDSRTSTSGILFRIDGQTQITAAIAHLNERELDNGYRYAKIVCQVPLGSSYAEIEALTCIAFNDNEFYLGPQHDEAMADEIHRAKGRAGPNHEYVLKLAENVRTLFPEHYDEHLFTLEALIRSRLEIGI